MIRAATIAIAFGYVTTAMAQEPSGCDKFKWSIEREQMLLTAATTKVSFGSALPELPSHAIRIELQPFDKTTLPMPPERAPKDKTTFAGFLKVDKIAKPGLYSIGISAHGWIDAAQDGKHLKSIAFTGATDCDGIRKMVKFELSGAPLLIQVSGVASDSIAIAVLPVMD